MRRMKEEPMVFYPITEYEILNKNDDFVNFYLSDDITKLLLKSPHAITMVFDESTVSGNHGGTVHVKMLPAKVEPNDQNYTIISYFGLIRVDEYYDLNVSCTLYSNEKRAQIQISRNYEPQVTQTHFATLFEDRLVVLEDAGYGIGNLINYSIEPVSDSLIIKTTEI